MAANIHDDILHMPDQYEAQVGECGPHTVIHNGEIAESGTHAELMEKKGIYYNMQKSQITT